ncbi:choice-of-anchor J domain-containing protein [Flavobacterium zepuense]|nr:choice-of-anchor J domain-containing protein [Flavobacterium zepuense]
MKKIYSLILLALLSLNGNAQGLPLETFEGSWTTPATNPGSGGPDGWAIINLAGPAKTWLHASGSDAQPAYLGTHAAYLDREAVAPETTTSDWLVTKSFVVPQNGQLRFFSKLFFNADQGTQYKVMISTTIGTTAQTAVENYTELASFTELEMNPTQLNWTEKIITLPTIYEGETVYIAFVMQGNQGDRWDIDNVLVAEQCLPPANLSAQPYTTTSSKLSWESTVAPASWDVAVLPLEEGFTGTGQNYTGTLPYIAGGLQPNTQYKFYVRANCDTGLGSEWEGPLYFTTLCDALPAPFYEGFNSNSSTQNCWTVLNSNNDSFTWNLDYIYDTFEGDEAARFDSGYAFANNDMLISPGIILTGNEYLKFHFKTANNPVPFKIMVSTTGIAPEDFTTELAPLTTYYNTTFVEKTINLSNLPAGTTYIAWYIPQGTVAADQLIIDNVRINTQVACAEPIDLTANNISWNAAILSWLQGDTESSWQVVVQPANGPVPTAATVGETASATSFNKTGLLTSTQYEYYVRSVCDALNSSTWAGPYRFTTGCGPNSIPFYEGFNSQSTTEDCWQIVNANFDWNSWNTDYPWSGPYEGDQAATLSTSALPNDWLISPPITLNGNQRLKYHHKVNYGSAGFKVMLSTTQKDPEDFTEVIVPGQNYTNTAYVKEIVSLANYTGTVYLAWQVTPGLDFGPDITIDNIVVENIPTCSEPGIPVTTSINQGAVTLSWPQGGNETNWEIFVQPAGGAIPTGSGIPANTNPFTITQLPDGSPLQPSTNYQVYVKAVCSSTDSSIWSDPGNFVTLPVNDNCAGALNVPVNTTALCTNSTAGTVKGATASSSVSDCNISDTQADNDDVWFKFTATATTHTLFITDIVGSETSLMYGLYSGNCSNLVQLGECYYAGAVPKVLRELVIGQTYWIRVFTPYTAAPQDTSFNVCIRTPDQPIAVSTTQYTNTQLITDLFMDTACTDISNVVASSGPEHGLSTTGIGYFSQNQSDFMLPEGIALTTGDVTKTVGPNYGDGYGNLLHEWWLWDGDADLNTSMAQAGFQGTSGSVGPSYMATTLEFDFVPKGTQLSFDFIFASEQYGPGSVQCFNSFAFAFLLTDSNGNTTNMAVVPDTNTPVGVTSIRNAAVGNFICDAQNEGYFDEYNEGNGLENNTPINFNGHTVPLKAKADLNPNEQYHLKLVVADWTGGSYGDSGVFIGKAEISVEVDLGPDLLVSTNTAVCANGEHTITTGLNADDYDFIWTRDGEILTGETNATLTITQPGTYAVQVIAEGDTCALAQDSVVIEFYPSVESVTGNPENLTACDNDGFAQFDFSVSTIAIVQGTTTGPYEVSYHLTHDAAQNNTGALPLTYQNATQGVQTIYVRIYDTTIQCYGIKSFTISVHNIPEFTVNDITGLCTAATGTITVVPVNYDPLDVTYTWTRDSQPLTDTTANLTITSAGVYTVTVNNHGCVTTKTVTVTAIPAPPVDEIADATACESYILPALSAGNTYHTLPNGGGITLNAGETISSSQTIYVLAQNAAGCTAESNFIVTINPLPQFSLSAPVNACSAAMIDVTVVAQNFDQAAATYSWSLNGTPVDGSGPVLEGIDFGTYAVTVTLNGCSVTKNIVVVKNNDAVAIAFTEGCEDDIYMLAAIDENGSFDLETAAYSWTGPQGFTASENKFEVIEPGTYTVTVTTAEGCTGTKQYEVLSTTCDIPKGISPNGDGFNDDFDLTGLDVKRVSIFNRYGKEVYNAANYTNQWHGQASNGDELPTGTYYYVVNRNNGEAKTGWVYINRQN